MSLNNNQKKFCQEYLKVGMNGTKAYMNVYKRSTEESARRSASELLTNLDVQEYISKLQQKEEDKALVTVDEIITGIKKIIDDDKSYNGDKLRGYELLGKYLGMFKERVEVKNTEATQILSSINNQLSNRK